MRIEPYPAYREKDAPNEYNAPAEDGSRPGLFYISEYQAETKSRSHIESTAFHETIPGHHLQHAIGMERKDIHPVGRYLGSSGYSEGWALYSERLADEMKLYSSDEDRLGMLSSQAFRAARLVVDTGIHALGWERQRAIDYMLAHTTLNAHDAASEIDRYIIWPGQATAYMLGRLEILAGREEARKAAEEFRARFKEQGQVRAVRTVDLVSGALRNIRRNPSLDINPAYSPDGRRVAFQSDQSGRLEVWVMGRDGSAPRPITRTGVTGHFLLWTRDGGAVVYRVPGPQPVLMEAPLDGGDPRPLAEIAGGSHISFSPTGDLVLDVVAHKTLWVSPVRGGTPVEIFTFDDPEVRIDYPVWSPDGRFALFDRFRPQGAALWLLEGVE